MKYQIDLFKETIYILNILDNRNVIEEKGRHYLIQRS